MLLRGQNLLGYRHYADDVVEAFVQKAIANGIDIIRIFDAFNDMRNLETAVKAAKKEGGEVQLAMCCTERGRCRRCCRARRQQSEVLCGSFDNGHDDRSLQAA